MPEQLRIEQGDPVLALAPEKPPGQHPQRHGPDGHGQGNELPALLPDQDPEHHATHADDGEDRSDHVHLT
jgi:hypothetical protein